MKRMKVVVEAEFEFPDDYSVAPNHEGTPSLKMGRKIFIPAIHWMEQTVFLDGDNLGKYETEPSRGFQPADEETDVEIMSHLTVEDSRVEVIELLFSSDSRVVRIKGRGLEDVWLALQSLSVACIKPLPKRFAPLAKGQACIQTISVEVVNRASVPTDSNAD
jgi:hypothetical protein